MIGQRPNHWILDDAGNPVPVEDVMTWAQWYEENDEKRIVARDEIGGILISTVFLGLDHAFGGIGPPILFESMIFSGPHDQYQERYATRTEALEGHCRAVRLVMET